MTVDELRAALVNVDGKLCVEVLLPKNPANDLAAEVTAALYSGESSIANPSFFIICGTPFSW